MDPAALQNLTPEQKQAVMVQAQNQVNQQVMTSMVESMTLACFDKCAGVSGDRLDSKEQSWWVQEREKKEKIKRGWRSLIGGEIASLMMTWDNMTPFTLIDIIVNESVS